MLWMAEKRFRQLSNRTCRACKSTNEYCTSYISCLKFPIFSTSLIMKPEHQQNDLCRKVMRCGAFFQDRGVFWLKTGFSGRLHARKEGQWTTVHGLRWTGVPGTTLNCSLDCPVWIALLCPVKNIDLHGVLAVLRVTFWSYYVKPNNLLRFQNWCFFREISLSMTSPYLY